MTKVEQLFFAIGIFQSEQSNFYDLSTVRHLGRSKRRRVMTLTFAIKTQEIPKSGIKGS